MKSILAEIPQMCRDHREFLYGVMAYFLIVSGFPYSLIGMGIIGILAAKASVYRESVEGKSD